jgi:hypothetical protein
VRGGILAAISAASGASNGTLQLPQRFQDWIGGNLITVVDGVITLGFTAASLVPFPAYTDLYVNASAADDTGNGLTAGTAKQFIRSAITVGNALGSAYKINILGGTLGTAAGLYPRGRNHHDGTSPVVPTQPCWYAGYGGRVQILCGTNGTWTLDTGTTYRRTTPTQPITRVVDLLNNNADGVPALLTEVASAAICRTTPGSWYDSGTNTYVNRGDAAAVTNNNTHCVISTVGHGLRNSTNGNTWITGIEFIGGTDGCIHLEGNASGRVLIQDCNVYYAKGSGGSIDAVQSLDVQMAVLERVRSYLPDKDAFNFHSQSASIPQAVLIDCWARESGYYPTNTSCNGPTVHDGGALLDIRGDYARNHGASCAHINTNTIAAHIGTSALSDYGDEDRGGATGQAAGVGFIALTGSTLYRYQCTGTAVASGGTLVDITIA